MLKGFKNPNAPTASKRGLTPEDGTATEMKRNRCLHSTSMGTRSEQDKKLENKQTHINP